MNIFATIVVITKLYKEAIKICFYVLNMLNVSIFVGIRNPWSINNNIDKKLTELITA